jgi:alanine-synthesizing transaminase
VGIHVECLHGLCKRRSNRILCMFSERTNWKLARNRFTEAVEAVRASGIQPLDLTASNPTRVGLKYESAAILAALHSERALDYDPQAKGTLTARQAVALYYRQVLDHQKVAADTATRINPERIVLTTGTSEGYSFVFRLLCNAGDELLVPKPSYPLFEFLADLQDVKLVPYPLIYDHGWQMDFPSLEKALTERTRGVVVVHPNNPTGSYVHESEIALLNAFCRAHGLALIVDEVFLDYGLETSGSKAPTKGEQNRTAKVAAPPKFSVGREQGTSFAGNREVLTFTLSGLSKISALPQMKVAWIVTSGPAEQVAEAMARLEMIADTYLSMNAPMQWAVPVLLSQRTSIQEQLMDRLHTNLTELDRQLAGQSACQRLCVEGGWYAVVRVPVTRSDEDLAIALVKEQAVVVHPGHFYDFPRDGYLVLSLITADEEFKQGVSRTLELVNR